MDLINSHHQSDMIIIKDDNLHCGITVMKSSRQNLILATL